MERRVEVDAEAFRAAIEDGNMKIVKLLLKGGANVNRLEGRNVTPLQYAVECDNEAMVRFLIQLGANLEPLKEDVPKEYFERLEEEQKYFVK